MRQTIRLMIYQVLIYQASLNLFFQEHEFFLNKGTWFFYFSYQDHLGVCRITKKRLFYKKNKKDKKIMCFLL